MGNWSTRAGVIYRRSYSRPKEDGTHETFSETIDRVIGHQTWLWERARNKKLGSAERAELAHLRQILLERKGSLSGRTLWLGGTEISKRREASQFNCSHLRLETAYDAVDMLWLLLQGCGVGFTPASGTLSGFTKPLDVEIIRSTRTEKGGRDDNVETYNSDTGVWTIRVGDSAEAWAKVIGKLLARKVPASRLVLDLSELRPAGQRLRGYGWISSGDSAFTAAFTAICGILNRNAGKLLSKLDILDIGNWMGTILSSRRSAEIALVPFGDPEWRAFATAKQDYWTTGNTQRAQSNNSLVFYTRPTKSVLREIFDIMVRSGGSEPGFINGSAALARAPWFSGVNPCAEILLGNRSFCNLVEFDISKYVDNYSTTEKDLRTLARANYRQTVVNLNDGLLQGAWHENNEYLRLCGVGLTGIVAHNRLTAYDYKLLRNNAVIGAYSMADELNLPRPKNVTTIKPSGTLSKVMDTTEGVHKPLGRYIFNNVVFSKHETIVPVLQDAGYKVQQHWNDPESVIITFPVEYGNIPFEEVDGKFVNLEPAVSQLNRYALLMDNYVDHNCSITVSYDLSEVDAIVDWIFDNWDRYVGVSFILRADPTKTAKDLGYPYLPQEVVEEHTYRDYTAKLKEVDVNLAQTVDDLQNDCATGACPIR